MKILLPNYFWWTLVGVNLILAFFSVYIESRQLFLLASLSAVCCALSIYLNNKITTTNKDN